MKNNIRVLIAKLGMDSHWRGAVVVARALRDAGMEVVFLGNQTPEAIITAAEQEDVDVIGLSSLSGNHLVLASKIMELVSDRRLTKVLVVLGGTIPPTDFGTLNEVGIKGIFPPGSSVRDIVDFIEANVRAEAKS